ncbi:MAG: hypothetical protein ABI367_13450 [Mucilaginibacter sp.]
MKVAYHFKCGEINFYDKYFLDVLLKEYLHYTNQNLSSKILIGDLCILSSGFREIDPDKLIDELVQTNNDTWKRIKNIDKAVFINENVFIVCFETIPKALAEKLHQSIISNPFYLGAFEIDNSKEIQWWYYGECIGPKYRIVNRDIYILTDSNQIEDLEYVEEVKEFLNSFTFDNIKVEYSKYRYSVFDDNHNYENAKRGANWIKSINSLFSTITDEITGKLIDTAPELTDRLWAITNTFDNAETGEQYAQAMSSCRRVFEYVTDCLLPATNEESNGHSLKKDKYKNRLIEFASREFKSETNIDLIVSSTAALFEEWENLYALSNKGVHGNSHRQECRRCIIRTILLLDDIISLKKAPFDVNIISEKFINRIKDDQE